MNMRGAGSPYDAIEAEVVPQVGKTAEAAKTMERLGFRVLHVANTSVSVQGSSAQWEQAFNVQFETRTKMRHPTSEISYSAPLAAVKVPVGLSEIIAAVEFAEPPQFFV
jgi:hypothetical protein